jgi:hypothetical protein
LGIHREFEDGVGAHRGRQSSTRVAPGDHRQKVTLEWSGE